MKITRTTLSELDALADEMAATVVNEIIRLAQESRTEEDEVTRASVINALFLDSLGMSLAEKVMLKQAEKWGREA